MANSSMPSKLKKLHAKLNKPLTKAQFLRYLDNHHACIEAVRYVSKCKTPEEAWKKCDRFDWMDWIIGQFTDYGEYGYPGEVIATFLEEYPEYVDWDTDSTEWAENVGSDEMTTLKKMAKELRMFVPWSYLDMLIKMKL